ncbi:membrane protein [Paenibacillus wynnii]|uniref:histidine kinase n=2 Tax=Paenibacillus wynnii TaxID=268407 RepID=A0A098MC35_9BACL|nr:sensor histidine kinase [Paenibacillus wynnii]KGE19117.1 membrane protein [Paenibacillus wynnii]
MRLFWKDQLPLLLIYAAQTVLVPLLYWLSGENRPIRIILYGMSLNLVILALYLGFRYLQHYRLYQRLSHPESARLDYRSSLGTAPLPEAMDELIRRYDQHNQEQLNTQVRRMDQHIEFINRWVHQMKTPLSVIQLTLQDVEGAAADSIQEELERLRKGLEMVIYTARLDRFEDDFHVEPTFLRQAVSEAVSENRRLFIRRGIRPVIQISEELSVYTDAKWLRFMLTQILTNAVNYTQGTDKSVTITSYSQGMDNILQITDQGIGISPEDLKRVFNPYFTGERGRQYHESTGMGLYLVREICTRLGHKVELESRPGEGTVLRLIFSGTRSLQ